MIWDFSLLILGVLGGVFYVTTSTHFYQEKNIWRGPNLNEWEDKNALNEHVAFEAFEYYILDVLCRQPIKLFQVVSTSEFHEY